MSNGKTLPSIAPDGSLSRYLQEIRKFPMLEKQQEYMLAKAWTEHGDTESAHKLVTSHLRLVAKIAMGYRGYGLPVGELISEGNVPVPARSRRPLSEAGPIYGRRNSAKCSPKCLREAVENPIEAVR